MIVARTSTTGSPESTAWLDTDSANRNSKAPSHSLLRFWAPRYWPAWILYAWMRFVALLPLSAALNLHAVLRGVLPRRGARHHRIARRNLELCFPELPPQDLRALEERHSRAVAMSFAECSAAWFCSEQRVEGLFDVVGLEHLHAALARGRGVILYTGHFTALEICGRALKRLMPNFTVMFSRRSNAFLDEIQRRGRAKVAHESIPRDNVRMMLRCLRKNAVVWYAPDQMYDAGGLVPFFHELAMTNLSTSRLAKLSSAAVVPLSYRRLEGQTRYEVRFHPEVEALPTDDPIEHTGRLVRILEGFIRAAPEQYLWSHRKYRGRPPTLPDLYAKPSG